MRIRSWTIPALFSLALVPVMLSGCGGGGTSLGNLWRDPTYSDGALKKLLVVALRPDAVRRRLWEDGFVDELRVHGIEATPSYSLYSASLPDTQQVVEAVRRDGYDGVMVLSRLANTTESTYVPGYTTREPVAVQNPYFRTYYTYWRDVQVPGYVETSEIRRFQIDVWTTRKDGRLIWSGTAATSDDPARGQLRETVIGKVIPELAESGIIPAK